MLLIIAIVFSLIFFITLSKWVKNFSALFYIGTIAIIVFLMVSYSLGWTEKWPEWFLIYVVMLFSRGALSTGIFVIVMYLGVANQKLYGLKKLCSIRGEMSIIASILALGHNIYYGQYYFVFLFQDAGKLEWQYILASILSLTLIAIMLPLMITSFTCVRKRMQARTWKKIQRLAYVFYVLLYVHVMVVLLSNIRGVSTIISILVYSIIFISYFVLRIHKYTKKKSNQYNILK